MKFAKMQGAGNDFVVIEPDDKRYNWERLAITICDRHYGVGADGLLLQLPSRRASFRMRIFNADGSESRACGNGMRCLVKHYLDQHPHRANEFEVTIETPAGIRRARVHRRRGKTLEIMASMGRPTVGHNGESVPETPGSDILDITRAMEREVTVGDRRLRLNLISIGNPHAVCFTPEPVSDYPLGLIGPTVEGHRLFPDETNFEVVNIASRSKVEARVWERGVGETLACGSGACAITVAGHLLGHLAHKVDVSLPGGTLTAELDAAGEVFLSGPAVTVFRGEWPDV